MSDYSGRSMSREERQKAIHDNAIAKKRQVSMPGESGRGGEVDTSAFSGVTRKDVMKKKSDPYSNPTRDDTPTGGGGTPAWGGKTGRPGGPDEGWAGPIGGGQVVGGSTTPFKGNGGSSSGSTMSGGQGGAEVPNTNGTGDHSSQGGKEPD